MRDVLKNRIAALLRQADIRINGDRPWDVQVHDRHTYSLTLLRGTIGLGEAYMDGWWDCEALDEFFTRVLRAEIEDRVRTVRDKLLQFKSLLLNDQRGSRSHRVGEQHYDIGNDLFERMLDRRMIYSCGYWRGVDDLNAAQEAKLDLVCRKLGLEPGMHVLDIGCGWGGAARFAAERYGVKVLGITIANEQVAYANLCCAGPRVEIREQDYRELEGRFDRIFSIGMFEHVGAKNYRTFFEVVDRCLKDDGLLLLHTIGSDRTRIRTDPWIEKYIFPNSATPSIKQIGCAIEGLFVVEDWQNFRPDYDRTIMAWHENINARWREIPNYDARFRRMWNYYLMSAAGAFRSGQSQLWQIVFSKNGTARRYDAPR